MAPAVTFFYRTEGIRSFKCLTQALPVIADLRSKLSRQPMDALYNENHYTICV